MVACCAQLLEDHGALVDHAAARGDKVHEAALRLGRERREVLDVVIPILEELVPARVLEDDAERLGPVLVPVVDQPDGPLGLDARAELDARRHSGSTLATGSTLAPSSTRRRRACRWSR